MTAESQSLTATESEDGQPLVSRHELDQLKGHFLASLNHEIRTPLSGVLGMTDLLLETPLNEEQHEYVTAARECASQLLDTLNSVLEYSTLAAGNMRVEREEFHTFQILEAVAAEALPRAEAKGLKLICKIDDHLPETVVGDARHLRQILSQLMRNAIKFTSFGSVELHATGRILGSESPPATHFLLEASVRDTGIGISSDKLKLIFDSFRQVECGLNRPYPGLGVGLAIADKLTRMMRGTVTVTSQPGIGSVFTVRIPLALPTGPWLVSLQVPLGVPRILVVEDNHIAQQVVSHMLGKTRYQFHCADSGAAGIEAASSTRYDLILMDLQMPGMDGIEAAAHIRKLPGYQSCPILALSANCSEENRRLCRDAGMQGFLVKPIQREELLAGLKQFLE